MTRPLYSKLLDEYGRRNQQRIEEILRNATHELAQMEADLESFPHLPGEPGIWGRLLGLN